jgi:Lrp/AsnC family transcriptional regulator for asnA, asnC and gidA
MQLDKLDWQIINLLSKKYLSNINAAKKLGVSEGTIRQRIKKMQTADILRIKALRDPDTLENQQLATIAVNVKQADILDKTAREISELDKVLSVSIVSGRYDLLIEVLVDSNKGLVVFLTESLSGIKGISTTETFLTLKSYDRWI